MMRIFYIYNINDLFTSVYEKYPYKLYKMLEEAYYTNKYSLVVASDMYEQVIVNFNKLFMNDFLQFNNKLDVYYYRKNNIHLISSNSEYSKLLVSGYCIKLKTNLNYPKFFETINGYGDNIFVCDFENGDYFWLNKIVKSVKIRDETIDNNNNYVVKC